MKNFSRKKVGLLLAAVMLCAAVLGGCGASGKAEASDTIKWFNASYAVLTELNDWDYTTFGGLKANEINKQLVIALLDEWWDVTDRASADETLNWILDEGHRSDYVEFMHYLEEVDSELEEELLDEERVYFYGYLFEVEDDEAQYIADMYSMYQEYGDGAIDGWDYCRALNLMGYYYIAGYYTEEEALDKSLEIARQAQPLFGSWDELIDSYLRGYEYWAEESSDERRAVYEDLKTREDNPFAVDYNTTLEKTW